MPCYASLHPARGKLTVEVKTFPGGECYGPWLVVKLTDGDGGHLDVMLNDLDDLGDLVAALGDAMDGLVADSWPREKEPAT